MPVFSRERLGQLLGMVPQQPLHRALSVPQGHGELRDGEGVWGALRHRFPGLSLRRCALAVSTDELDQPVGRAELVQSFEELKERAAHDRKRDARL